MRLLLVLALSSITCSFSGCAVDLGPDPSDDLVAPAANGEALTGGGIPVEQTVPPEPALVPVFPDKHDPGDQPAGGYSGDFSNAVGAGGGEPHIVGRAQLVFPGALDGQSSAPAGAGTYSSNTNLEHRIPPPPPCITCPRDPIGVPSTPPPRW